MSITFYRSIHIGAITLHYETSGTGFPLILIHGSLSDLRYWEQQIPELSKGFKVITYSRRFNYPNTNPADGDHSAVVEARDLLEFMDQLEIEQTHILSHSYGAYTALVFALQHPGRIQKLILAEPPIMQWLPEIPGGENILEDFMNNVWNPLAEAFKDNDRAGLEITSQWFYNTSYDNLSAEWQEFLRDNVKEWKALVFSSDAYPYIETKKLQNLDLPVLLLSGEKNNGSFFDLIESRLKSLLPNNRRVIIENAGHEMFIDNPGACNAAILKFLKDANT